MKVYKLTDENGMTRNNTQWGENVTHTASGDGELCSDGWIHCCADPSVAAFMNPVHAEFTRPRLWEAESSGRMVDDGGLKMGVQSLTTIRELPCPAPTTEQCIRFAILCTLEVTSNCEWRKWADSWLNGADRTDVSAKKAAAAAKMYAEMATARYPDSEDVAMMAAWVATYVVRKEQCSGARATIDVPELARRAMGVGITREQNGTT